MGLANYLNTYLTLSGVLFAIGTLRVPRAPERDLACSCRSS